MVLFAYLAVEWGKFRPYTPAAILTGTKPVWRAVERHGNGATG